MISISERIKVDIEYKYLYNIIISSDPYKSCLDCYQRKYRLNEEIAIKYPIVKIYYNDRIIQWDSTKFDIGVIKDILRRNVKDKKTLDEFLDEYGLSIKFDINYYCPENCTTIYE